MGADTLDPRSPVYGLRLRNGVKAATRFTRFVPRIVTADRRPQTADLRRSGLLEESRNEQKIARHRDHHIRHR